MPLGAFTPSQIHLDYPTWQAPVVGDVGKVWAYTGSGYAPVALNFDPAGTAAAAVAAHVAAGNPHTQYLLESAFVPPGSDTRVLFNDGGAWGTDAGLTYAKATDRLTVAGGLVAPSMRPVSDGTSALGWFNAAGTQWVYGDTTNQRIGIGGIPTSPFALEVFGNAQIGLSGGYLALNEIRFRGFAFATFGGNPGNGAPYCGYNLAWDTVDNRLELPTAGKYAGWYNSADGVVFYAGPSSSTAGAVPPIRGRVEGTGYLAWGLVGATALLDLGASDSTRASLRIRAGTAPSGVGGPNAGDIWYPTGGRLNVYRAATETIASGVPGTGGAATAGASYTSAEQSMIQKVYDACRAFGLLS